MAAQIRVVPVEVVRGVKVKAADQQVDVAKEDRAAPVVEGSVVAAKIAEAKVVPGVVRVADKVADKVDPAVELNAAPVVRAVHHKVPIPNACWNMPSSLMRTKTASSARTNCKSSSTTS